MREKRGRGETGSSEARAEMRGAAKEGGLRAAFSVTAMGGRRR